MRSARFLGADNRPVSVNPTEIAFISAVAMTDANPGAGNGRVVAALGMAGIQIRGMNKLVPVKGTVGSVTDEWDAALAGRVGEGAFAEQAAEVERLLGADRPPNPLLAPDS